MAEPFSVIAGVLGTLDASTRLASKASSLICTLKNAPADILALANELEDLRVVLNEAELAKKNLEIAAQGNPALLSGLCTELSNSRAEVDALEAIVDKTWVIKVQKRLNWLRKQGDIEKRRNRLRNCRERLRDLLVTHNVIAGSRIELELSTVHATLQLHRTETSEALTEIRSTSRLIRKELEVTRSAQESSLISPPPFSPPPSYAPAPPPSLPRPPPYAPRDPPSNMTRSQASKPQPISPGLALAQKAALSKKLAALSLGSNLSEPMADTEIDKSSLDNLLYVPSVSFRVAKRASCPVSCWCQCHSSSYQLPLNFRLKMAAPAMKYLSGCLFMAYTGSPLMGQPCNSHTCKEQRRTRFQATYTFPSWLIRYSIELYYERYGSGRPNMGMKVRNRVDIWSREGQSLLAACASGSTDLVMKILQNNPYQMHDITVIDGGSPLLQAVRVGNSQISKLLLAAGADPDEHDDHGVSPRMELARLSLVKQADLHSGICGLFDIWGFLQDSFFPAITKSVLQFPGAPPVEDFDERIVADLKLEANARDDLEWQPLHWAVARGDVKAAKLLLRMGADPNSLNGILKRNSLHLAGLNNNSAAVIPDLVKYGAVATRDLFRRSPMDHAAYYGSLDSLKAMISSGVDPIFKEWVNASPMYCAAFQGRKEVIEYLLSLNDPMLSNIDLRDVDGETSLVAPIYANKPEILELLLQAGGNAGVVSNDGMTLLMMAAVHGSLDVLKVLAKHDLSSVDVNQKSEVGGSTARQLFSRRLDASDELKEVFERIVHSIGLQADWGTEEFEESDEEVEFHDALEGQTA